MVEFGPSGRCEYMEELGIDILKVPKFLSELGLTTFEYPFTHGVNISESKAKIIGEEFKKYNISLSAHAPYYINLATPDDIQAEKSYGYIIASIKMVKIMGADRLVFHPGSLTKQTREEALNNTKKHLVELVEILKHENLLEGIFLCPETMGKHGQIGTVEEVADFCTIDEHLMPALDFGHINAFTLGGIKDVIDYENIFKTLMEKLGQRGKTIHSHFSRIKFGDKGELTHLNFDSPLEFGPDYKKLNIALKNLGINGRIICESKGHQTKDALMMFEDYKKV